MSIPAQSHLLSVGHLRGGNPDPPGNPIPYGQQLYTSPGTYTWIAPEEAAWTNISAVVVAAGTQGFGPGRGGPGGALVYGNNIPIIYGKSYTVVVGGPGSYGGAGLKSYIQDPGYQSTPTPYIIMADAARDLHQGPNGPGANSNAQSNKSGGGGGGPGGPYSNGWFVDGAGGAGGYTGDGGAGGGGTAHSGYATGQGLPGSGGGGGGGGGANVQDSSTAYFGGNGGGVGMHGEGTSGTGGSAGNTPGTGGGGGSPGPSGEFGGGGGSSRSNNPVNPGQSGGVRILWGGPPAPSGGTNRRFPTTNVS